MQRHEFVASNGRADGYQRRAELIDVLRRFFPNAKSMRFEHDLDQQRHGVDATLTMHDGSQVTLDFKFRDEIWNDFALEFMSDEQRGKLGWVADPNVTCDFVAYIFVPLWECQLLPRVALQRAWSLHKDEWLRTYGVGRSFNKSKDGSRSWVTLWCAVDLWKLLSAVEGCRTARLIHEYPQ
jgi:hypothetical protein